MVLGTPWAGVRIVRKKSPWSNPPLHLCCDIGWDFLAYLRSREKKNRHLEVAEKVWGKGAIRQRLGREWPLLHSSLHGELASAARTTG